MSIKWNNHYPDPNILKKEVKCMLEAFVEVLLGAIPRQEIAGIYFKGSAQKDWESPLDYVPEISDIDIHLLFANDSSIETYLGTTEQAIGIQSKVEKTYISKITNPYHIPRPQLVVLNPALREQDFVSSPKSTIIVLFGKDYPKPEPSKLERIRMIDCQHLINEGQFLQKYPLHIIDKPSKYLWQSLRNMVWHISPIGSRVLSVMGTPYEKAWGMNRTKIVALLNELGEQKLVRDYSQFYLSGWDYFLSNYADTNAGRKAIIAGVNVLRSGIEIAETYLSSLK